MLVFLMTSSMWAIMSHTKLLFQTKLPKSIVFMFSLVTWFKLSLLSLTLNRGYVSSHALKGLHRNFSCSQVSNYICRKSSFKCVPCSAVFFKNSFLFQNLSCNVEPAVSETKVAKNHFITFYLNKKLTVENIFSF